MTIRVAINGYGRIGRSILRAYYENKRKYDIQIVAVNDLGDIKVNAYLTKYDTVHGRFCESIVVEDNLFIINGDIINFFSQSNPLDLPWKKLKVDVVLECTGFFLTKKKASMHLRSGAKKVILSAPSSDSLDATIVYGVNNKKLKKTDVIISNSSCTTNCLAPLLKPLHKNLGVLYGLMTTIHSYTNDQVLTDVYHKDYRRARSATQSMIPTKTGAAASIGLVIPDLKDKLDGCAIRVPTINNSIVDLSFISSRKTNVEEVNNILKIASETKELKNILQYNTEPLVSVDINHNSASSIFDSTLTKVSGCLVKVFSWYDNEWGFSNRMLDVAEDCMLNK